MAPSAVVYLDTNVFIFALEGAAPFASGLADLFASIDTGGVMAVTSELTLAEVLVRPFEIEDDEAVRTFELALSSRSGLSVEPVDRAILRTSAKVRAELGGKLPDAIHIATAVERGCRYFVTEDHRLRLPPNLIRRRPSEYPLQWREAWSE